MKKHNFYRVLYILLFVWSIPAAAQTVDTSLFYMPVTLDEVMVSARQRGFNVPEFIQAIKEDTTFYKAFKTIRLRTYNADNNIVVYNKKGGIQASLSSETKQIYRDGCRTMRVLEETTTGDFYNRKKEYNYFTAELYAGLFFTKGTICHENNIVKGSLDRELAGKNRIEKSKVQLKMLMFNPGSSIPGIPFIGNKVGIFEPEVAKMYDFRLSAQQKNGEEAYCFEAVPKPEYAKKVVINRFVTWFRPSDYSIISRDYSLSYDALGYDFDVVMHVDLKQIGKELLPGFISYKGNWKVVTQSRERVNFTASFTY